MTAIPCAIEDVRIVVQAYRTSPVDTSGEPIGDIDDYIDEPDASPFYECESWGCGRQFGDWDAVLKHLEEAKQETR